MQEASAAPLASPSPAFLADAVEASALSSTPTLQTFLRTTSAQMSAEAANLNMPLQEAVERQASNSPWPPAAVRGSSASTPQGGVDAGSAFAAALAASASKGTTPRASIDATVCLCF